MWVQNAIRRRPITHASAVCHPHVNYKPAPSYGARHSCSTPLLWSSGVTLAAGVGLYGWLGGRNTSASGRKPPPREKRSSTPVQDFVADTRETQYLSAAPWLIPHDEKVEKGGEDTYFITADGFALGVFDGVGGWANSGVNPREYSYKLMQGCKVAAEESKSRDAMNILTRGWLSAKSTRGSSTACVAVINPVPSETTTKTAQNVGTKITNTQKTTDGTSSSVETSYLIDIVNVGDSGVVVVENATGQVVFHTKEQQHYFNCPYQLGSSTDRPEDGDRYSIELSEGHTMILATDGLLDNLSLSQLSSIVLQHPLSSTQHLAKSIASEAYTISRDTEAHTPFTINANAAGFTRGAVGGKPDDITVLVVRLKGKKGGLAGEEKDIEVGIVGGKTEIVNDVVEHAVPRAKL